MIFFMIHSYLWYTLFIWNNYLFVRLLLFILCVYFYIIILEILLFIKYPFSIVRLLFSHAYYYIRYIYFLFYFDQYVEVQIFMQNISWFIYDHSWLFSDLFIESHFLIIRMFLYFVLIYLLNITFRSSEYKETIIHIFHSFLHGDTVVSDNGIWIF